MDPPPATNELAALERALVKAAEQLPIVAAYLYGSRAHDTATAASDWDVAIFVPEHTRLSRAPTALELELVEILESASGLGPIDARIVNSAPLRVRGRILTEGRLLFSGDEAARVRLERETRIRYLDYLPRAQQLDRDLLAGLARHGLNRG